MMRSLFSGVSGLRAQQTGMDVIGNNIANVNSVGFKASRATFADIMSQTVAGASAPQNGRGGTNPKQVGLGTTVASIDTLFGNSSMQSTGVNTDLAIQNNGFFMVTDGNNQYYTRAGNFNFDELNNFGYSNTGFRVMGWMANAAGVVNTTGAPVPIQITNTTMDAKESKSLTCTGNLAASAAVGDTQTSTATVYDQQGLPHDLTITYTKNAANDWTATITPVDAVNDTIAAGASTNIVFDGAGKVTTPATFVTLTLATTSGAATPINMDLHFEKLTQTGKDMDLQIPQTDGYASGVLNGKTIDVNGNIVGSFTNNRTQVLGQIALADFDNPGGLQKVGNTMFAVTSNSGAPKIGTANTGSRGSINPGNLEMSNVDLAQEFANMIVSQRAFQANSKIISTTDEMLQELANLKR